MKDTDVVFKALADRSRRMLLDRLHERDGQTLTELCADIDMSRQAVTQHLDLLEAAHLVVTMCAGGRSCTFSTPSRCRRSMTAGLENSNGRACARCGI
jgi:DNA-binding transcriptional ArsR family regulator